MWMTPTTHLLLIGVSSFLHGAAHSFVLLHGAHSTPANALTVSPPPTTKAATTALCSSSDTSNDEAAENFNLDDIDFDVFRSRQDAQQEEEPQKFDGYMMRDLIFTKWGECYDVDFNKVDTLGFKQVFLNVFPFKLGGRGARWRHETELDYLMHLQAVVEILEKYEQLDHVIYQIQETNKVPKMGAPIKAVPIKLELTEDEVNKIMGK